jgi:hypothetical protein
MTGDGWTKLFSSILTSSIWSEDDKTRILWVTILACTDKDGFCQAAVPGLAAMARLTVEDTAVALAKLEGPDPYSRTQDHEGRRIEKVDGGWVVLNHGKYRDRDRIERRREYRAEYMREKRRKDAGSVVTDVHSEVTDVHKVVTGVNKVITGVNSSVSVSVSDSPSGSEDQKKEQSRVFTPPSSDEVAMYASEIGYPLDGQAWCDSYAQKGWMVGRTKMKDWKAAVRNWKAHGWKAGQPMTATAAPQARPPMLTADQRRAMIAERGG